MSTGRTRCVWRADNPPRCFSSKEVWTEWMASRPRACSPCVDCSQEYKDMMMGVGKCERPETVFVIDTDNGDGSREGLSCDDPRMAVALAGGSDGITVVVGEDQISFTSVWADRLAIARGRAHKEVQIAIDQWFEKYRQTTRQEKVGDNE